MLPVSPGFSLPSGQVMTDHDMREIKPKFKADPTEPLIRKAVSDRQLRSAASCRCKIAIISAMWCIRTCVSASKCGPQGFGVGLHLALLEWRWLVSGSFRHGLQACKHRTAIPLPNPTRNARKCAQACRWRNRIAITRNF